MSEFEATFFDMDGVTVETAHVWRDVEETHVFPNAIESGTLDVTAIRGLGVEDAYGRLTSMDGVELAVDREGFERLYDERVEEVYGERARLLPGYYDLLSDIRAADHDVGLVSASERAWVERVLDRFDLHDAFDVVVGADDVHGPSKPAPDCYEQAARAVDVDPTQSIAVEDSPHGIEAARDAGMYCLALRGNGNADLDLSLADDVADGPADLGETIRELIHD